MNSASHYTGLFQPGSVHGFIRLGSAASYSNGGLTPGLGLKFPRTGQPSGNYVALHSLDLGQSWNFFAYNVSNHISPPVGATAILAKKFNQASQCAPQVPLLLPLLLLLLFSLLSLLLLLFSLLPPPPLLCEREGMGVWERGDGYVGGIA